MLRCEMFKSILYERHCLFPVVPCVNPCDLVIVNVEKRGHVFRGPLCLNNFYKKSFLPIVFI